MATAVIAAPTVPTGAPRPAGTPPLVNWLSRCLPAAMMLALTALMSLAIAQGAWPVAGAVIGLVTLTALVTRSLATICAVWVLGIPTAFTYANNVLHGIPSLTVDRLLFLLLVGMMLASHALRRERLAESDRAERAGALFLLIATVSLVRRDLARPLADVQRDGAFLLNGYVMPLASYAFGRRLRFTASRIDAIVFGLLGIGIFLGVVGLAQVLFGIQTFDATFLDLKSSGVSQNRAYGTLGGAAEYGTVIAFIMLLGWYAFHRTVGPARLLVLAAVAVSAVGLVVAQTRAPWLGFLLGVVMVAVLDRRARPAVAVGFVVGLIALAAAIPVLAASGFLQGRVLEVSPIYNRVALTATTLNMVLHHPLLGLGFGARAFLEGVPLYLTSFAGVGTHYAVGVGVPHDEFLHIMVLLGIPGFIVFVATLSRTIGRLREALRAAPLGSAARDLAVCAAGAWVIYFTHGLVVDFGPWRYFTILLFFLTGVAVRAGCGR